MKTNTVLVDFLIELVKRWKLESPRFFKVFQMIGLIATLITGVPELLAFLHISLPESIAFFANKTIAIAGAAVLLISKLTVKNPEHLHENNSADILHSDSFVQCPKKN